MKTRKPTVEERNQKRPSQIDKWPEPPVRRLGDLVDLEGVIHSHDKKRKYVVDPCGALRRA